MDRLPTSKEKLNDPKYRSLIYANEAKQQPSKRRKPQQQEQRAAAHLMPTHRALVAANVTKNDRRLRGGGSSELEPASLLSGNTDFTWYNRRFTTANRQPRLEGGGGGAEASYPAAGCGKATRPQGNNFLPNNTGFQWDSTNPTYLASNKCNLRNVDQSSQKQTCSCPPKDNMESMLKKKGHAMCTKKPCMGTDCLIKAFKDAQDFVDNFGKVPGLAGLGITESPYFGKPQEVVIKADTKPTPSAKQPESQNLENLKKSNAIANANTFSPVTARKPGLVQEAITSLPDPSTVASLKSKKKDEKTEKAKESENNAQSQQNIEDTPCGEPKCKSRPKKVEKNVEINGEFAEKTEKSSQKGDRKSSKGRSRSGPSGDRPKTSKSSKSAKANQFLYNFGNAYPASVYGHKTCSSQRPRVPAHMGWMWNQTDTIARRKPRPGWRPGAISVQLRDLLNEAKAGFFKESMRPRSAPTRSKKGKLQKTMSFTSAKKGMVREEEEEPEVEYPPTLHIHRKDGVYYVTMYPIRQDGSNEPRLDEPINPLQFKIVKSKTSLASSSTASDMEIEFSPPAAVNRQKKKPNVIHVETQVKQQDILDACKAPNGSKKKEKSKKDKGK